MESYRRSCAGSPRSQEGTVASLNIRVGVVTTATPELIVRPFVNTKPQLPWVESGRINTAAPQSEGHTLSMYKIHRDETGIRFACSRCTYSVLVHKRAAGIGSPRTFAADILLKHAKEEHDGPRVVPTETTTTWARDGSPRHGSSSVS
jgi:hypothetical protein